MPEGDTVYLAGRRLHRALGGKSLTRTDFRVPRYATTDLSGRTLNEVASRGKHLMFRIEGNVTLHTHFKMQGSWHLYRSGQRWKGPGFDARVILENADHVAVGFRLPVVDLIETAEEAAVVGHLGPDLLAPDWDADEAARRMMLAPDRPVAETLLDQSVMAGLGNVYKSEICFLSGLDPSTPVAELADPGALIDLSKRVIEANRETGSQITTGDPRPGRRHWVYGRAGQPCRRCGTSIRLDAKGERVTYWCPRCQPIVGSKPAAES